jgi:hypothetical protein
MNVYRVFATATATAEHSCNCDRCTLAARIEVKAVWSQTFPAKDAHEATARARSEIGAALDDATPDGYLTDYETEHVTIDVSPVSDLEAADYPRIPGL